MKNNIVLFIIIIISLVLRIYSLDKAPLELFGDEIDVGLQASSILQTGKDYSGNPYPVMFKSFGEYRLPLYIYSSVPFISVFGLNEWGLRLTDVFWGILGIIGLYFLTKILFNAKVGLISATLLAISPWHIQYSRQAGIEALLLLTIVTWAVYFFLVGLNNFKYQILSVVLFALSIYAYATAIIFVPVICLVLIILNLKIVRKLAIKKIILLTAIGIIIAVPYLNLYISGQSAQRFSTISIWSDNTLVDEINTRRKIENSQLSPFFHNKPLIYSYEMAGNYVKALSLDFLFFKGDPNLRHSIGSMGEFYWFELILFVLGIYLLVKIPKEENRNKLLIIIWLLISPIPASLTRDGSYHASRLIFMLVPITIICALGMFWLIEKKNYFKNKILLGFIGLLIVFNFTSFVHRYLVEWPHDSWRFWQYGFKDTYNYLKQNDSISGKIIINNTYEASFPRFLFWYEYDPKLIQTNPNLTKNTKDIIPGLEGFSYNNKYYFGGIMDEDKTRGIAKVLSVGDIYIASYRDDAHMTDWRVSAPRDFRVIKTILDPNNDPIFFVVTK